MLRQVNAQSKAEITAAFGPDTAAFLGTGLFFQGLMRGMPSFKKVKILMFQCFIGKIFMYLIFLYVHFKSPLLFS